VQKIIWGLGCSFCGGFETCVSKFQTQGQEEQARSEQQQEARGKRAKEAEERRKQAARPLRTHPRTNLDSTYKIKYY